VNNSVLVKYVYTPIV